MKICFSCQRIINEDENINIGDQCPNKDCKGDIIFLEDIVVPIYISLREKNYKPYYIHSGKADDQTWKICVVSFFPPQCYDLLPPPPKGFIKRYTMDSVVIERELINTVPSKLHNEAKKSCGVLSKWAEKLPPIINFLVIFSFHTESEANSFIEKLKEVGNFHSIIFPTPQVSQFIVSAIRDVKEEERKIEFANLVCIYEDSSADSITIIRFQIK